MLLQLWCKDAKKACINLTWHIKITIQGSMLHTCIVYSGFNFAFKPIPQFPYAQHKFIKFSVCVLPSFPQRETQGKIMAKLSQKI